MQGSRRAQLHLVAGLVAVGVFAVVGIVLTHQGAGTASAWPANQGDALLQTVASIHGKGGRLTMLDDDEDPGALARMLSVSLSMPTESGLGFLGGKVFAVSSDDAGCVWECARRTRDAEQVLAGVGRQRGILVRGQGGGAGVLARRRNMRRVDAEEESVHHRANGGAGHGYVQLFPGERLLGGLQCRHAEHVRGLHLGC